MTDPQADADPYEDEDDNMPRCACCLGKRWPEEMNPGDLCDDCYDEDDDL